MPVPSMKQLYAARRLQIKINRNEYIDDLLQFQKSRNQSMRLRAMLWQVQSALSTERAADSKKMEGGSVPKIRG